MGAGMWAAAATSKLKAAKTPLLYRSVFTGLSQWFVGMQQRLLFRPL